jgi:membrane protein implicated in regulation of membrane protease activity
MGYIWLAIAILFLFAELNTPGLFFFISFTLGAMCASILAFLNYSFIIQCSCGLLVSIISFWLLRKYLKRKNMSEVSYGNPITNIDALVGRQGIVVATIEAHGTGSVRIGGEVWRARGESGEALDEGIFVVVLRVEGNTVIVKSNANDETGDEVGDEVEDEVSEEDVL